MPASGLPQALEGSLREAPSDSLFWVAAGLTLVMGLLLQRAPKESNRWVHVLQRFTRFEDASTRLWLPNFLMVALLSVLAFIILGPESMPHLVPGYQGPWYGLLVLPILALASQIIVHSLFGLVWEDHRLHWRHWSERFSFLPALWIALPFLLWFLVSTQSKKSILEPFFVGVVILGLLLYVMGLFRAFYRYVKEAHAPWYLAILYLCTLEASPIFWILLFQSYEG